MIRLAALALAAVMGTAGAQQQYTMKLATSTSGDALVEWLNTLKKGVEAGSGGRIKAEVYPASQLGQIPRQIEGVALGTIELAFNASGFYEPLEPRFAVLAAPGLFDGPEHGFRILHDPAIQQRLSTFGAAKGVEALSIVIPSQYVIVSHKPINTLADFKGQKIRVPGSPLQIEPLKRFGASPLSMPFGEVLPALQNRTIDGVWAGTTLFTALKFYDIAKTMTYLPSHWAATVPLVNRNFMKSLGPDLEKIVRAEARKADEHVLAWATEDIKRSEKIWAQNGGKEVQLPAAEQKRFLDESIAATTPILTATPQGKEDYEAFAAAARKYRK
ncbi:MAG TPA: TRAP transporter substrate-binding protein [Burkholderiales bacterium]|nr:TRAP transporter substrate-binding protein [Burkholderiales bacterium]